MKQYSLMIILPLLFILTTCKSTARYEKKLDSWKSRHIEELLNSDWGHPLNKYEIPNGNTVYVYKTSRTRTMPSSNHMNSRLHTAPGYYHPSPSSGSYSINYWCQTSFEVDKKNVIVDWKWKGNDCKAK